MIPVTQTIVDPVRGDCVVACIASIFEVAIGEVPSLGGPEWEGWHELYEWLRKNYGVYIIHVPDNNLPGYTIGGVKSTFEGKTHAVVVKDGNIIHCPSPSRHGLDRPLLDDGLYVFVSLDPAACNHGRAWVCGLH